MSVRSLDLLSFTGYNASDSDSDSDELAGDS